MVGDRLARDLLSFGRPILAVGDPAQLPPIDDKGAPFMGEADALLTEIHRQARGNPILRVAEAIREGRSWRGDIDGKAVRTVDRLSYDEVFDHNTIICGTNRVRRATNRRLRDHLGLKGSDPIPDEILVCLANDYDVGIFNGETSWIEAVAPLPDFPAVSLNLRNIGGSASVSPTNRSGSASTSPTVLPCSALTGGRVRDAGPAREAASLSRDELHLAPARPSEDVALIDDGNRRPLRALRLVARVVERQLHVRQQDAFALLQNRRAVASSRGSDVTANPTVTLKPAQSNLA